MSRIWRLTVRDEFSAAHALRNYRGKCERPHGHNFSVEVSVEGEKIGAENGMLVDFKILKDALKCVLAGLDHCMLNSTEPFDKINPSSENLAKFIWEGMVAKLGESLDPQARNVRLAGVCVSEKDSQSAAWIEK